MPVTPVTVYAVTCDACPAVLDDEEGGTFITDVTGLAATLRPFGWTVLGDEVLCHLRDEQHQQLMDAHMPPHGFQSVKLIDCMWNKSVRRENALHPQTMSKCKRHPLPLGRPARFALTIIHTISLNG